MYRESQRHPGMRAENGMLLLPIRSPDLQVVGEAMKIRHEKGMGLQTSVVLIEEKAQNRMLDECRSLVF